MDLKHNLHPGGQANEREPYVSLPSLTSYFIAFHSTNCIAFSPGNKNEIETKYITNEYQRKVFQILKIYILAYFAISADYQYCLHFVFILRFLNTNTLSPYFQWENECWNGSESQCSMSLNKGTFWISISFSLFCDCISYTALSRYRLSVYRNLLLAVSNSLSVESPGVLPWESSAGWSSKLCWLHITPKYAVLQYPPPDPSFKTRIGFFSGL